MAFTGQEDHSFPLETASEWTAAYRDTFPTEPKAHYFGGDAIKAILEQADCVGIRIYYGLNDDGERQLIVVGVTEDENDLYDGLLAERSIQCPPSCGAANPLNS